MSDIELTFRVSFVANILFHFVALEVVRGGRKGAAAPPLVFEYEFHLY